MQTTQEEWPALANALGSAIQASDLNDSALAKASGANYFAVRRMRLHGIRNQSENAKKLCIFFKLIEGKSVLRSDSYDASLEQRIRDACDGTAGHRQFIEQLLDLLGQYKIKPR